MKIENLEGLENVKKALSKYDQVLLTQGEWKVSICDIKKYNLNSILDDSKIDINLKIKD